MGEESTQELRLATQNIGEIRRLATKAEVTLNDLTVHFAGEVSALRHTNSQTQLKRNQT